MSVCVDKCVWAVIWRVCGGCVGGVSAVSAGCVEIAWIVCGEGV